MVKAYFGGNKVKYFYRVEQHIINTSNKYYGMLDEYAIASKNMYNKALYVQRAYYFKYHKFISYVDLWNEVKSTDEAKKLPLANMCQTICRQVTNDCFTFKKTEKAFLNNPDHFSNKVKLPNYKRKNKRNIIELYAPNVKIKNEYLEFPMSFNGFRLYIKNRINEVEEVRITKKNRDYIVDIVYMITIKEENYNLESGAAIDLGVDNFATIVITSSEKPVQPKIINGKGLKSYNKRFNSKINHYKTEAKIKNKKSYTRRINKLYECRRNFMKNFMHQASRKTIDWCLENKVKYLVIGYNHGWKNKCKMSKGNYFNFMMIPYEKYVRMVSYKARAVGIKVILHEEAYTSGTSFLDNELPTPENYDKSRRVRRGLFISNRGIKINADVNGAYQILRKVFPKVTYDNGIVSCCIQPVKYNVLTNIG